MNNGHTGEDLTDRRSQPEDLLQFKAAFEYTNVGMAIVALDGRFKNVNRALCDLLGYTDAELMAKRFSELTHPDDVASSLTNLRLMLAGELTSFRAEKRYLHKSGDTVWVELTSTLARDAQRQPLYFISQLQDIRQRKQAEQAAHDREDQYAEALRIARLANWEFDIATGNFILNDQFYALLRTTAEHEGGHVLSAEQYTQRFVHPDDAPSLGLAIQSAMEATNLDQGGQFDHRVIYSDGSVGYVTVRIRLEKDAAGNIVKTYGVSQDITARKQAEENLRRATEGLHAIFWRAQVTRVDEHRGEPSEFQWANQFANLDAMQDFLPLPDRPDLSLADNFNSTWLEEDRQRMDARSSDALRRGLDGYSQEFRLRDANGKLHWMYDDARIRRLNEKQYEIIGFMTDITARKQAEETLAEERNRLRVLIDNLPYPIFIKDRDSRYLINNIAHLHLVGTQTQEAAIGKTDFDYFPSELASQYYADEQALMQAGQPLYNKEEAALNQATGQKITVSSTKVPLKNVHGEVIGFVGFTQDITERKRVENALKAQAAFWQHLIDNIPSPIFFKDIHGVYQGCNIAFEKYLGRTRDQIIGLSVFDMSPKDLAEKYHAMDQALFDTPGTQVYESEVAYSDGSRHKVIFNKATTFSADGQVEGLVGIIQDITERKSAEEALVQERTILRTLIDNVPDYMYIKDTNSRFILANSTTAMNVGGFTPEELIGKTDFDFFPHEIATSYYNDEQAVIRSGRALINREEPTINAQGERRWLLTTKVPLFDAQGKIIRLLGIGRDITESKLAEEALRRSEEQLAEAQRLAQLANWEFDVTTGNFTFNDQFYALLHTTVDREGGYQMSPMQYAQRFVHPEDAPLVGQAVQQALESTDPNYRGQAEHRVLYADGGLGYFTVRFAVAEFVDGHVTKTYGANQDITARKLAEAELQRLLVQEQRRAVQLQTATDVSRAAASILDPDELIATTVELVRERFGLYYVGLFLIDESNQWAVLRAGTGEAGRTMQANGHRLPVGGQSMIGWCIAHQQARIALDVGDEAVRFENPLLPLTRSEMALPLISRGRVVGAATIQSTEPKAFSADDIAILQTMADQLTTAVVNAQLFEQTRQTLNELDTLNRRLTGEAWQAYTQLKGNEQAVVWHSTDSKLTPLTETHMTQLSAGEVVTQVVNDEAHVSLPIALRGQLIGALRFRVAAHRWTENAQMIATSIAGHLAQAVENARLIEQTQRIASREKQIATASDRIHRATDLDRMLQTALEEIIRITGAQDVGIQLGTTGTSPIESSNGQNGQKSGRARTVEQPTTDPVAGIR